MSAGMGGPKGEGEAPTDLADRDGNPLTGIRTPHLCQQTPGADATVVDVDDIISFHSESVAEFQVSFHAVIDGYVSACAQLGTAPEKPASGKLIMDSRLLRG